MSFLDDQTIRRGILASDPIRYDPGMLQPSQDAEALFGDTWEIVERTQYYATAGAVFYVRSIPETDDAWIASEGSNTTDRAVRRITTEGGGVPVWSQALTETGAMSGSTCMNVQGTSRFVHGSRINLSGFLYGFSADGFDWSSFLGSFAYPAGSMASSLVTQRAYLVGTAATNIRAFDGTAATAPTIVSHTGASVSAGAAAVTADGLTLISIDNSTQFKIRAVSGEPPTAGNWPQDSAHASGWGSVSADGRAWPAWGSEDSVWFANKTAGGTKYPLLRVDSTGTIVQTLDWSGEAGLGIILIDACQDVQGSIYILLSDNVLLKYSSDGTFITSSTGQGIGIAGTVKCIDVTPVSGRIYIGDTAGFVTEIRQSNDPLPDLYWLRPDAAYHAELALEPGTVLLLSGANGTAADLTGNVTGFAAGRTPTADGEAVPGSGAYWLRGDAQASGAVAALQIVGDLTIRAKFRVGDTTPNTNAPMVICGINAPGTAVYDVYWPNASQIGYFHETGSGTFRFCAWNLPAALATNQILYINLRRTDVGSGNVRVELWVKQDDGAFAKPTLASVTGGTNNGDNTATFSAPTVAGSPTFAALNFPGLSQEWTDTWTDFVQIKNTTTTDEAESAVVAAVMPT